MYSKLIACTMWMVDVEEDLEEKVQVIKRNNRKHMLIILNSYKTLPILEENGINKNYR